MLLPRELTRPAVLLAIALGVATAVVLGGVKPNANAEPAESPATKTKTKTKAKAKSTTVRIGAPAPLFDLPVIQGQGSGTLEDFRGRVVVLKFWATYCGYCKSIRKALVKFAAESAEANEDGASIAVLAISFQGTKKLKRYLRKNTIGLPVLHDKRSKVARRYRARATPTLVVIDACGVTRFHRSGAKAAPKAMKLALELAGSDC